MSEVGMQLNPEAPRRQREKRPKGDRQVSHRRAMITSIIIGSIAVHVAALVLFGLWTVAKHFRRPEARFEMKKVLKICLLYTSPSPRDH